MAFIRENLEILAKTSTIEALEHWVGMLLKEVKYNTIVCENQEFQGIYRARNHNTIFGNIDSQGLEYHFNSEKEFWNPPKNYIKYRGRCNDVSESLFYGSNEFETALAEVRPKKNQFITIATFEPILKNGEMPKFNVKPICIQHLQKIKTIIACAKDYDLTSRPKALQEFDHYLDKIFTETVSEKTDYKYNLTIAITRCMLVDMMGENQKKVPIEAMLYPSILRNLTSSNILFKPEYIQNNFEIKHLQTFKILSVNDNGVEIKLLRNGTTKGFKKNHKEKLDIEWFDMPYGDQEFIEW